MSENEVKLIADFRDGKPVYEVVPAIKLADNLFRLTASPGFAPGVAAGDEIEITPDERFGVRVVKHGGNVCVQIFLHKCDDETKARVRNIAESIGGWLDGGLDTSTRWLLILTIPVVIGFDVIEGAVDRIKECCAVDHWMYGNVYSIDDGVTPLNWWRHES